MIFSSFCGCKGFILISLKLCFGISPALFGRHAQKHAVSLRQLPRGGLIVAKASRDTERVHVEMKNKEESSSGRRDLLFAAAAAAAACSIARVAMADEEPKSGTPEAKKKYAPICVTMPTARICRN
ncbi:hypothetical protein OIU84_008762 [Salix udensis]|uniref:Photosystem II 5 kDa protein n=1 Tax=Salix udensis TaxID=889485 RepID=A0AAD6JRY0_9ROSI|nr:hypothetical protein OIU84_008762 [Salix udensis]